MTSDENRPHDRWRRITGAADRLHRVANHRASSGADSVLAEIVDCVTDVFPQVQHAGVLLWTKDKRHDRNPRLKPVSSTGPVADEFDRLQLSYAAGPAIEAALRGMTVTVRDLAVDERWPTFVRAARGSTPVRSALAFELPSPARVLGAVTLCSDEPGAFGPDDVEPAEAFAVHASAALSTARLVEQLRHAVETRDTIGQAKGMLMERHHIDADAAFDLIRRLSQDTNTPVVDLAEQVVNVERFTKAEPVP